MSKTLENGAFLKVLEDENDLDQYMILMWATLIRIHKRFQSFINEANSEFKIHERKSKSKHSESQQTDADTNHASSTSSSSSNSNKSAGGSVGGSGRVDGDFEDDVLKNFDSKNVWDDNSNHASEDNEDDNQSSTPAWFKEMINDSKPMNFSKIHKRFRSYFKKLAIIYHPDKAIQINSTFMKSRTSKIPSDPNEAFEQMKRAFDEGRMFSWYSTFMQPFQEMNEKDISLCLEVECTVLRQRIRFLRTLPVLQWYLKTFPSKMSTLM